MYCAMLHNLAMIDNDIEFDEKNYSYCLYKKMNFLYFT